MSRVNYDPAFFGESSSTGDFHPQALTDTDVSLSAHQAPIIYPTHKQIANGQTNQADEK